MVKLVYSYYQGVKGLYKISPFCDNYLLEFKSSSSNDQWVYSYESVRKAKEYMELFDKYSELDLRRMKILRKEHSK